MESFAAQFLLRLPFPSRKKPVFLSACRIFLTHLHLHLHIYENMNVILRSTFPPKPTLTEENLPDQSGRASFSIFHSVY